MKKLSLAYFLLLLLTICTFFFAGFEGNTARLMVVLFACLKFLLVAFYFMELRIAHPFWKLSLAIFVLIFAGLTLLFLPT
jgi:hypothetical protein